jgi:hypothetical protein
MRSAAQQGADMPELPPCSIALSKRKTALLLACGLIFVAIGVWLIVMAKATGLSMLLGGSSVLFFGGCSYVALKKLMDRNPGLVVTAQGVTDNSAGASAGMVPWADVASVQARFLTGQKFVSLMLHDPQAYAQRGNQLQKYLGGMNIKLVGTPVSISANSLSISFDELLTLLQTYHRHHQETQPRKVKPHG